MARQIYLPRPWPAATLPLPASTRHHLFDVLRRQPGQCVTYTDGEGAVGEGTLAADHIRRGEELFLPRPQPAVRLAVAPPRPTDRLRFLVEKATELGVDELIWLATDRGEGRPPRPGKAQAWIEAAVQQSGGAWAPRLGGPCTPGDLEGEVWVAAPGGNQALPEDGPLTIAVGPEGGWAPGELDPTWPRFGLGATILRTETAAVAAAVVALAKRRW